MSGCTGSTTPEPTPEVPEVVVLTSNFQAGGVVGIGASGAVSAGESRVHGDAILRREGTLAYVINRLGGDNLQVLDLQQGLSTQRQWSLEPGSNPQDIALLSPTEAVIVQYERSQVQRVDLETGTLTPFSDLSGLAEGDPDGLPELSSILRVQDSLLVTAQRLARGSEGYVPLGDSYLVKLDAHTGLEQGKLKLAFANPYGLLKLSPDGTLLVSEPGRLDTLGDGGVEIIDPVTLSSLGAYATDAALGGEILEIQSLASVDAPELPGYVALLNVPATERDAARTRLVRLNARLELEEILLDPEGWQLWDVERDPLGQLWVSDRDVYAPGVWLLLPGAVEVERFIPFGSGLLPPTAVYGG